MLSSIKLANFLCMFSDGVPSERAQSIHMLLVP